MIPESQADKLLAPIYTTYTDVETTILAQRRRHPAHAALLQAHASKPPQQRVDELAGRLEEALEDWLYSSEGESLEQIVLYYLGLRQATLAVAESCTGGMIAAAHHRRSPGSSRSFLGGAVVYSERAEDHVRRRPAGAHRAARRSVGRSGHGAGRRHPPPHRRNHRPRQSPASPAPPAAPRPKPVGLVYIAVSDAQKTESLERNFRGDRDRVREWTTQQALDLVRRRLM